MKNSAPLYLSAREAAGELGISTATLYAYVSRGLIRSEPTEDARARRYRADDVRALKNRRAPPAAGRAAEAESAALVDSAVSTITPDGPVYRGVGAVGLSGEATLEQAATLLWDANRADPFAPDNLPVVGPAMRAVASAAAGEAPLARAIAVLALAGDADPGAFSRTPEGRVRVGARVMRLLAAAILGREPSPEPLHRQLAAAWAPAYPRAPDLVRRALVLLADHELNASTFAVRVAASTGLNPYDAAVAGLVALKGPRHGGAGPLAARMVADLAAGDVAAGLRERVALGETIPGFGHLIYEEGDPRAEALLAALAHAGADRRFVVDAPALVAEATGLRANIDFALAVLSRTLSLPAGSEVALFAVARCAGWLAHAFEQLESGALVRPRARYVGPAPRR
ncbi:MAG TPA: MerR family transcriptional regulator [Rhizobiales bacterium]|nr:MerR family transcriptional regulator [Hyphomicrobiales bacterium]